MSLRSFAINKCLGVYGKGYLTVFFILEDVPKILILIFPNTKIFEGADLEIFQKTYTIPRIED